MVTFYRHWLKLNRGKQTRVNTLLFTALLLFALPLQAGNLISRVDRHEISSGETLTLTVSLDQQVLFGEPDFSALDKDFDIVGRNRQSRFSNSNGKRVSYTQWLLTLSPKKTGLLIIPSFSFKGEVSDAFEINVVRVVPSASSGEDIYVRAELEKPNVYVQEQALLTLRLLTAVPLNNFAMSELAIPNAQVVKLSENQFQKRIENKDYIVVETRFAVFSETSGELTIPPVRYTGVAQFNYNRKRVALETDAQILSVKPRPSEALNTTWLPAQALSLSDNWTKDKPTMTVGEPVTRTIILSARGLTAAQLPPLAIDQAQHFKIYKDQAQLEDSTDPQGVSSRRIESMAIVPSQAGALSFPEIRVQWWDAVNKRLQTALLPSVTFEVLPGADTSSSQAQAMSMAQTASEAGSSSTTALTSETVLTLENGTTLKALVASNVLFALLSLTFASLWWRRRVIKPATTSDQKLAASSNGTLKFIRLAAANDDYAGLREAVIQWARSHWQDASIHTLEQVVLKAEDASLKPLFQQLDARLYDNPESSVDTASTASKLAFDSNTLIKHLEALHKMPTGSKETKSTELRGLYPE